MPEPFYRRDYDLEAQEKKKANTKTYPDQSLQNKSAFMRGRDETRGLLSAFETASKAKEEARNKGKPPSVTGKNPWELPQPGGGTKKPTGRTGFTPTYDKDRDTGAGDKPDTSGSGKTCPGGTTGTWPNCTPIGGEDKVCPKGQVGTPPNCKDPDVAAAECPGCDLSKNDCVNGKCTPKKTGGDEDGGDAPSLTTINQPDETPMLQTLTSEMDLRNMLSNVLNKNNPLFKQARTRALQAMAGRGTVNSSMAEEAVTSAILNVAMPIATRVIDDLQRVMAANVNATNAFKQAVNEAYYKELLLRVEAANTWNLSRMTEAGANWRAIMEARGRAADTSDPKVFERYMDMLGGAPGFHLGTPTYDIAGT